MGTSLKDILQVSRLHTGMATAAVPAVAVLLSGGSLVTIALVALAALFHHAWGFSLNEVMDYDIDRKVKDLSGKPLVSGRMTKGLALFVSSGSLILSFAFLVFATVAEGSPILWPLVLLFAATMSGALYDVLGKKLTLSDLLVALWMLLLVLAGASAAGGGSLDISVIAIAVLSSLHILYNNSVEGGLKDVENDRECGGPTLAVASGSSFKEGRLTVSTSFLTWGLLLRGAFILLASVFAYLVAEENGWGIWLSVSVSIAGLLLFTHSADLLMGRSRMGRKELIKQFAVHEVCSFALSLLVIAPAAGIIPVIIALIVPIAWFAVLNGLLFRSPAAPDV